MTPGIPADPGARLVDRVMHQPRHELVHDNDCPACDMALEVTAALAAHWDPNDTWTATPATDGLPGDDLFTQCWRTVVYTLHRRVPGHQGAPAYPHRFPPKEGTDR